MTNKRVLVTGAGGFIGHHLVKRLKAEGHWVRGVDIKYPEYEPSGADEMLIADLRFYESCVAATAGAGCTALGESRWRSGSSMAFSVTSSPNRSGGSGTENRKP